MIKLKNEIGNFSMEIIMALSVDNNNTFQCQTGKCDNNTIVIIILFSLGSYVAAW